MSLLRLYDVTKTETLMSLSVSMGSDLVVMSMEGAGPTVPRDVSVAPRHQDLVTFMTKAVKRAGSLSGPRDIAADLCPRAIGGPRPLIRRSSHIIVSGFN